MEPGNIAIRGSIVDVFPSNLKNPIRVEFFDNQIESIRNFDVNTQISIEIIDQMAVEDLDTFIVSFSEGPSRYSVEDMKITDEVFTAKLDKYISLKNKWK